MMRALCLGLLLTGAAATAAGQQAVPAAAPQAAAPATEAPSAMEKLFASAPVFRGELGELAIQASLRQKEDMREGLEGEYFVFGRSQKILLAGEFDRNGAIFLEESENGQNVSGQWEGNFEGDTFKGLWSSFDGSVEKPFRLKLLPLKTTAVPKKSSARPLPSVAKP
ncbi:MAG TPA: hypothetical protein VL051_04850 [Burkholderiaceae bacterium]|nr:hypothetical protein [Burkholderiaceae bacterium]